MGRLAATLGRSAEAATTSRPDSVSHNTFRPSKTGGRNPLGGTRKLLEMYRKSCNKHHRRIGSCNIYLRYRSTDNADLMVGYLYRAKKNEVYCYQQKG